MIIRIHEAECLGVQDHDGLWNVIEELAVGRNRFLCGGPLAARHATTGGADRGCPLAVRSGATAKAASMRAAFFRASHFEPPSYPECGLSCYRPLPVSSGERPTCTGLVCATGPARAVMRFSRVRSGSLQDGRGRVPQPRSPEPVLSRRSRYRRHSWSPRRSAQIGSP